MAYNRKKPANNSTNTQQERTPLVVTDCTVTRARAFANGSETFDLRLNGITIYGCRLVDGKNGTFVSYPSRKGTDGNYYSHVYAYLDDSTVESICKQVEDLLAK